jgi:hypothetical protein
MPEKVKGKSKRRKRDKGRLLVSLTAIGAIVFLEWQALQAGIDGSMLALSFAVIGAIAGAKVTKILKRLFG